MMAPHLPTRRLVALVGAGVLPALAAFGQLAAASVHGELVECAGGEVNGVCLTQADDSSSLLQTRHLDAQVRLHGDIGGDGNDQGDDGKESDIDDIGESDSDEGDDGKESDIDDIGESDSDEDDDGNESNLNSTIEKLVDILVDDPHYLPKPGFLQVASNCRLDDEKSGGCKLDNMTKGAIYNVYPGKASGTACLDSSAEFYFKVRRGASDKLLMHFQEGGACWDSASWILTHLKSICLRRPTVFPWEGILDGDNAGNPYRDYTVVQIMYCSGDLHVGDTSHWWGEQRGYKNANSAIEWTMQQLTSVSRVVFVGTSAGSLGVQMWSDNLLTRFREKYNPVVSTVLADSFVGALNPFDQSRELEGILYSDIGMCDVPIFTKEAQSACRAKQLTVDDLILETMQRNPLTAFTYVQSKVDKIQITFAKLFAATNWHLPTFAPVLFYKDVNVMFDEYALNDNFFVFLINGDTHVISTTNFFWTATPLGPAGHGSHALSNWTSSFKDASTNDPKAVCEGDMKVMTSDTPEGDSTDYCNSNIMPVKL